jgi:hypothetical protein
MKPNSAPNPPTRQQQVSRPPASNMPLEEGVAALALVVCRETGFHLRRKRLVVGKWPVLGGEGSEQQSKKDRAHTHILTRARWGESGPPRAWREP